MAEKITPTFIIKLVILFSLLLTGVYLRPNKTGMQANAKTVLNYEKPAADEEPLPEQDVYYKLVKNQ